jgi:RhtB (resistance to homoserine/threonine) family protein
MVELISVVIITVLAVISPGPDFAMVSRNSVLSSRRTGVLTAVGIGGGVLLHVGYTLLGVGLVIQQTVWLFDALKIIGAAYLVWLGVKMLRTKTSTRDAPQSPLVMSDFGAVRTGFLTNALNPKTTVFIVSLFMQIVEPATPLPVQLGYGLFICAAHVIWFSLVALFFSAGTIRNRIIRARGWIDRLFGSVLVGFGVMLALTTASR